MCFAMKAPKPPPTPPLPNRQDEANQAAVQSSLQRARGQNASAQTILTGGLGDPDYGRNVSGARLLGETAP